MPGNSEKGPSEATRAMLTRQSKPYSEPSSGATAISVVAPPPFFQAVVRQSAARVIFTINPSSAETWQVEVFRSCAFDRKLVAGVGMPHHAAGRIVPQNARD